MNRLSFLSVYSSSVFGFLLLLLPSALHAAGTLDEVRLTFNRTGSDAASVQVSVADQDGNAVEGAAATLVSTSFAALKTSGAAAITNGSVLAPDSYANDANAQICYLFCITGLPSTFSFDSADIDVYALTAGGTAQGNTGNTVRYFRFAVATGSTADVTAFASKDADTDICTVTEQTDGLYHSIQTMTAESSASSADPLYVKVTLTKTSALGCYAGIGMVSLYTKAADVEEPETFSADKFYTIHRNGNASAYIYQKGSTMGTAQMDNTKSFWWVLEPTGNADSYYIRNATTGQYVQSSVQTLSSLVPMGSTPVEFQIKKDETAGAATNGYYYIASTDQTISVATDGSLGLNFGATGVVAYYIKTGRGNSYWQIEESDYAYEPPVVEETDYARAMQIYSIPCGAAGGAYLSAFDIAGDDVLSELHYSTASAPASYYTVYVVQKADVRQGGNLPVTVAVAGETAAIRTFAYADWDRDGVFETCVEHTQGGITFAVPVTTAPGQYRIRVRVTETDTDGAEDDVIGSCTDFIVNVVAADAIVTWSVAVNDPARGVVTAEADNGILLLKATPLGNAEFIGWRLMHSYFAGELISTDAVYEFPLTQSARIVAVFTPNTDMQPVAVGEVHSPTGTGTHLYDASGHRLCTAARGIVITKGKKWLRNR